MVPRRPRRALVGVAAGVAVGVVGVAAAFGLVLDSGHAGPQGDGTAITTTGWKVTPTGKQVTLGDRPYGLTQSPDGRTLLVSNDGVSTQSLQVVDTATGAVRQTLPYEAPEALFLGVAYSPDGTRAYASSGQNDEIRTYAVAADGTLTEGEPISLDTFDDDGENLHPFPAGLAVSPDGTTLYVADHFDNTLSIVEIESGDETRVPLSDRTCTIGDWGDTSGGQDCQFAYAVTLSKDGAKAYVSDWGQDTVAVIDTARATRVKTIKVGTHPSALTLSPTRDELYVADTESDAISVIDTRSDAVLRTTNLHPCARSRFHPHIGSQEFPRLIACREAR